MHCVQEQIFHALDPKFNLVLEPQVLKLKVSSFGNGPFIYVKGTTEIIKVAYICLFKENW